MEERVLITPSGFFGKDKNNIYTFFNFMEKEEIFRCLEILESNYDSYYSDPPNENYSFQLQLNNVSGEIQELKNILLDCSSRATDLVMKEFNCITTVPVPPVAIWKKGNYLPVHAEKENILDDDPVPEYQLGHDIGGVIYLNNDYVGGEIYFPDHDIQIKPEPGMLVFFPGDGNYGHGVTRMMSGRRYAIPLFWNIKEHL
jgi:hypothetical protein